MDSTDDFDRLGKAVARVLRETFATASEGRADPRTAAADELDRVLAEIRALPARAVAAQEADQAALRSTLDEARRSAEELLAAATEEAAAIRAQAMADAKVIVEGAGAEIARAKEVVAEERVKLDAELKDLVRNVHRAVSNLEGSARHDHEALLDRATSEARMILRQARLHHRSTAREVDRMIEAAAAEAAALRKSALSDAARIAARVRGVVEYPGADSSADDDEPRPPAWVRPNRPAPEESAPVSAAGPEPVADDVLPPDAGIHRRRLRPLAS